MNAKQRHDIAQRIELAFEDLQNDADRARYDALLDVLCNIAQRVITKRNSERNEVKKHDSDKS